MENFSSTEILKSIQFIFNKSYPLDFSIENNYDEIAFNKSLDIFKTDFYRYFENEPNLDLAFTRIELIGILFYRLAREYFLRDKEDVSIHLSNLGRIISGFEIYYSAEIGHSLKINHGLGTIIGARSKIGNNALIHQNVTFGDRNGERPTLKDNVIVYAGAKILGGITINSNSIIGANSVCMINVPKNSTVVGIPGKIIKT